MSEKLLWEATSQDKELVGKLIIACSISTDPANKLSLSSSLITKVNACIESKFKTFVPPTLDDLMGEVLIAMLRSIDGKIPEEVAAKVDAEIERLFGGNWDAKQPMEVMRDYYLVKACSDQWKHANSTYREDRDSWIESNKELHDIFMTLDSVIRRNDLASIPKNVSFSTDDLNIFKSKADPTRR
jgi:hypothetical protein